jgi:hypothetical protein
VAIGDEVQASARGQRLRRDFDEALADVRAIRAALRMERWIHDDEIVGARQPLRDIVPMEADVGMRREVDLRQRQCARFGFVEIEHAHVG